MQAACERVGHRTGSHGRPGAVVLAGDNDGTPILAAGTPAVDAEAVRQRRSRHRATRLSIKGGGGGKAAMAQAGGRCLGLEAALKAARAMLVKA